MIAQDIFNGKKHFVAKEYPFGIDTICNEEIPCDRYILIEGYYSDCNCSNCLQTIHKDLKKKSSKNLIKIEDF
jgi:hypothetical protein